MMSDTILVAIIGAFATVMTALFQIFMSSKQAASGGRSSKNRIKGLVWTGVLFVAAAVGGFAYSEYLVLTQDAPAQALRDRIGHTLMTANAMAPTAAATGTPIPATVPPATGPARTDSRDGVAVTVALPACKGEPVGLQACSEQTAMNVALCAPVPAAARVTEVVLYTRPEGSTTPWREHVVTAGQDLGSGRFLGAHFERQDGEQSKDVCQKFAHWGGEPGRSVRIVVRYDLLSPPAAPTTQGASPPPAEPKPAG